MTGSRREAAVDAHPPSGRRVVGLALDELYRADHDAILRLAYVLCGSHSMAEDVTQDAFLAAHRSWARVGAYDDPGAWVRRVAINRSVSAVRRRASEAKAVLRLAGQRSVTSVVLSADAVEFWREVRALPKRQAQAVALHYLEDRSVRDIAVVLGCAESTVKVHLHRGRAALAVALRTSAEEPG